MAVLIERARNEGFLLEEANGGISRDVVTLASGQDYTSGSVVINVGGASTWSLVTADAIEDAAGDPDAEPPVAAQEVKVGIVCRHTDATAAAHKAAIIARHAEVIGTELIFGAATDLDDVDALLKAAQIIARDGV